MSHDEVILLSSTSSKVCAPPPILSPQLSDKEDSDDDLQMPFGQTEGLTRTSENDVRGSRHAIDSDTSDSEGVELDVHSPPLLGRKRRHHVSGVASSDSDGSPMIMRGMYQGELAGDDCSNTGDTSDRDDNSDEDNASTVYGSDD